MRRHAESQPPTSAARFLASVLQRQGLNEQSGYFRPRLWQCLFGMQIYNFKQVLKNKIKYISPTGFDYLFVNGFSDDILKKQHDSLRTYRSCRDISSEDTQRGLAKKMRASKHLRGDVGHTAQSPIFS